MDLQKALDQLPSLSRQQAIENLFFENDFVGSYGDMLIHLGTLKKGHKFSTPTTSGNYMDKFFNFILYGDERGYGYNAKEEFEKAQRERELEAKEKAEYEKDQEYEAIQKDNDDPYRDYQSKERKQLC